MTTDTHSTLAVVLASGGLDSCVTTAIASQTHALAMLHVNYGQRTEKRELRSFNDICDYYSVLPSRRLIVNIEHLKQIGGSSLTDNSIPVSSADLHNKNIPSSYVPFRNANILAMAVSWAETIKAEKIYIGAVQEDSSGYPDCRSDFFEAYNQMIRLGTKPGSGIEIITPIIHLQKSEIVREGLHLNAPLSLTWSCYQSEDEACGVCDSCALRLRGFQSAGIEDPILYRVRPKYD